MRVAALTTLVAGARAMSLKAGAQVPKFAVTAHTGAAVSSDSLAGSAYCLWFYPKADTGGATRRGDSRCLKNRPRDAAAMACWAVGLSTTTPRHRRDTRASCVGDATPSPRHSPSAAGVETATVAGRRLNRGGAGVHGGLRPVQGQGLRPLRRELRRRRREQGIPREVRLRVSVALCVEINQCDGCFFTNSFLADDAADLAWSSGEEPASPRHRAGVVSMAWRTTRRFSTNAP